MNAYTIALFLHIVGAPGYFATLGVLIVGITQLQRARMLDAIREWADVTATAEHWLPVSAALLLLSGVSMVLTVAAWRGAWIITALIALLVLAPVFPLVLGRRLDALRDAARTAPAETASPTFAVRIHDPALTRVSQLAVAASLGIVFLMTVKPDLAGSVAAMGSALALGVVSGLAVRRPTPAIAAPSR